jgi:hypothetical protein
MLRLQNILNQSITLLMFLELLHCEENDTIQLH